MSCSLPCSLLRLVLCLVHVKVEGTGAGQPKAEKGQGIGEAPGPGTEKEREEWELVSHAYCSTQCAHRKKGIEKEGTQGQNTGGAWSNIAGHGDSKGKGRVGQGMLY